MSVFVVDASVAVKWVLPEIHTQAARRLLGRPHQYFAPDLLFAEVGNVIWKKVRRRELPGDDARRLISDFARCAIDAVPCRALLPDAHSLAIASGRTVYDAMYLALAVRMKTRLITADERLCSEVRQFPLLAPHVELLASFQD